MPIWSVACCILSHSTRPGWVGQIAFALSAAAIGVADASAQAVLVRISGPDASTLKSGAIVRPGVRLAAGTRAAILTRQGTLNLAGPLVITAETLTGGQRTRTPAMGPTPGPRQKLAGVRSGVVAGQGAAARAPDLWVVQGGDSGAHCLMTDMAPVLWRASAAQDESVRIETAGLAQPVAVAWRIGADRLDWPRDLRIKPMQTYRVTISSAVARDARVALVRFVRIRARWPSLDALDRELAAHSCTSQRRRLD